MNLKNPILNLTISFGICCPVLKLTIPFLAWLFHYEILISLKLNLKWYSFIGILFRIFQTIPNLQFCICQRETLFSLRFVRFQQDRICIDSVYLFLFWVNQQPSHHSLLQANRLTLDTPFFPKLFYDILTSPVNLLRCSQFSTIKSPADKIMEAIKMSINARKKEKEN